MWLKFSCALLVISITVQDVIRGFPPFYWQFWKGICLRLCIEVFLCVCLCVDTILGSMNDINNNSKIVSSLIFQSSITAQITSSCRVIVHILFILESIPVFYRFLFKFFISRIYTAKGRLSVSKRRRCLYCAVFTLAKNIVHSKEVFVSLQFPPLNSV